MKLKLKFYLLFLFYLFFCFEFSLLAADIVRLKNGSVHRGKILLEDDEKVFLAEHDDYIRYINKDNVLSITYEKLLDKNKNAFVASDKDKPAKSESAPRTNSYSGIATPIEREPPHANSQGTDTTVDVTHEIVTDFIWRGLSFSGEMANRRRNDSYTSTTFVPSYQPTIDINTPLKGFKIQFWGNFQLSERNDRSNDGRLQLFPGGPGPAYAGQPFTAPDPDLLNQTCVYDTQNNVMNGNYATGSTCGGLVPKSYKEQNGMKRADGLFYAFYYSFEKTSWGKFTVGTWFYNTFHKNPAYVSATLGGYNSLAAQGVSSSNNTSNQVTRLAWQEYYIFWQLPEISFLPFIAYLTPTLSFYTQMSQENAGWPRGKIIFLFI